MKYAIKFMGRYLTPTGVKAIPTVLENMTTNTTNVKGAAVWTDLEEIELLLGKFKSGYDIVPYDEATTKEEEKQRELDNILDNNKLVQKQIKRTTNKIEQLSKDLVALRKEIKAPCLYCPYEGVYRCEACKEQDYAGFSTKDFPEPTP